MNILKNLCLGTMVLVSLAATAQEQSSTVNSSPSNRSIPKTDMMYRKTVWRTIDLREKQNKPLFADGQQITRIIIDAVKRGELPIYKNDSLTSTLTQQEFIANLSIPGETKLTGVEREIAEQNTKDEWNLPAPQVTLGPDEFFPKDLYLMELKEDQVFDKKRSRMYHEIKSISLVIPAGLAGNVKGRDIPVGTLKYSDLVKVFRNHPVEAVWFNPQNDAMHKNLADAFDLRLFGSYITKVSNPDNAWLEELHGGQKEGLFAASQVAEKMLEYEYNLWSF